MSILRRTRNSGSIENPPFVPSPRWLSMSPDRPPSGSEAHTVTETSGALYIPSPSLEPHSALLSPVPPPPPNLYQGLAGAVSVDPGNPFLATAGGGTQGSSSSESRSIRDDIDWPSPKDRRFGGGIVSGLKRAVGSLKQSRSSRRTRVDDESYVYTQPPQFRDSGYATSTPEFSTHESQNRSALPSMVAPMVDPIHTQPPAPASLPNGALLPVHSPQTIPNVPPRTVSSHMSPQATPFDLVSPLSPVSADPQFGPDYALMDPPTPPPSDTPLTTYLSRAQRLIATIAAMPWVSPERVTVDYYPERVQRRAEPKHAPQIGWTAEGYTRPTLGAPVEFDNEDSDASTWGKWANDAYDDLRGRPVVAPLITPRRGAYDKVDLGEEFEEVHNTPMPTPVGTPRFVGGGASLYGGQTPRMVMSSMQTPEMYPHPMTPLNTAHTPGAAMTQLPQDPPQRVQVPSFPPLPQNPPQLAYAAAYPPMPQNPPRPPVTPPPMPQDPRQAIDPPGFPYVREDTTRPIYQPVFPPLPQNPPVYRIPPRVQTPAPPNMGSYDWRGIPTTTSSVRSADVPPSVSNDPPRTPSAFNIPPRFEGRSPSAGHEHERSQTDPADPWDARDWATNQGISTGQFQSGSVSSSRQGSVRQGSIRQESIRQGSIRQGSLRQGSIRQGGSDSGSARRVYGATGYTPAPPQPQLFEPSVHSESSDIYV